MRRGQRGFREMFDQSGEDVAVARELRAATGKGGTLAHPSRSAAVNPLSTQGTPGDAPFSRLVFPPRVEKLPSSLDFFQASYATALPAGIGSTVVPVSFQLPGDNIGFLQQFAMYIASPVATTRLTWTVRINEGPIAGWEAKPNPNVGAAPFLLIVDNDLRVRITNSGFVDVLVTNLDGAAVTVGAFIGGWYHPRTDELRMYGPEGA